MSSIDNKNSLRMSLTRIKETGFSIRPDLRESEIEKINWMIGFRPIYDGTSSHISVEVRANAINTESNVEVAFCSIMVTYNVDNINDFVTNESDTKISIRDHLMLNMLNPAFGTLRGVMHARFASTLLEQRPLPMIDIQDFLKATKRNEAITQ